MEKKKSTKRKVEDDQTEVEKKVNSKRGKKKDDKNSNENKSEVKKKTKQGTLDLFNIEIKTSSKEEDSSKLPEIPSEGNLTIYSWNVNGLRATLNKGAIEKFVQAEQPDIFCLNETKIDMAALKKDKLDKLFSETYQSYWNCCQVKNGYSGVAIFTKYRPLRVTNGIDMEEHDQEGRVITAEFPNFYIVAVYVVNSGEGLKRLSYRTQEWDVAFFKYLHSLKEKKDVILCGDLNVAHKEIDVYDPKGKEKQSGFTPEERKSFSEFLELGYLDTFRHLNPEEKKFTYFTARQIQFRKENKGWRLDYFIINDSAKTRLVNSEILNDYEGSDHTPIKLTWKV